MSSYVYFIGAVNEQSGTLEAIKIGKANDPVKRLGQLHKGTSAYQGHVILNCVECRDEQEAFEIEKMYHESFSEERIDDNKEWFKVSLSLLSYICETLLNKGGNINLPQWLAIGTRT